MGRTQNLTRQRSLATSAPDTRRTCLTVSADMRFPVRKRSSGNSLPLDVPQSQRPVGAPCHRAAALEQPLVDEPIHIRRGWPSSCICNKEVLAVPSEMMDSRLIDAVDTVDRRQKCRSYWAELSKKWTGPGSNRRHMDFQSIALPTELPVLTVCQTAPCCAPCDEAAAISQRPSTGSKRGKTQLTQKFPASKSQPTMRDEGAGLAHSKPCSLAFWDLGPHGSNSGRFFSAAAASRGRSSSSR